MCKQRISSPQVLAGLLLLAVVPVATAWAGLSGFGFRARAVGGVSIEANGIVMETTEKFVEDLRNERLAEVKPAPMGMDQTAPIRKISLRGLDRAIAHAHEHAMGVLPDEVKYLGGLQRIQYIFVYPEQKDIVIAGPAEGWKVAYDGSIVGETTGRPVVHLDDLLVAFRHVHNARTEGISCSIDPTAEGRRNLEAFLSRQQTFAPAVLQGVEQALGMQEITLTGIPADSRFARMMVAADYRMKRIAMKLEPAPVRGLPSYLDLVRGVSENMTPRWWMACNYEPIARSEDGLAWELRGQGVKVLTEDEFVADDGTVKQSGRTSGPAERWAEMMTEKYDELATAKTVFGDLRNLMDLCVVAAVIEKHDLLSVAGCELPMLLNREGGAVIDSWTTPRKVATQSSFVKKGGRYIITASGGVQIESWQAAANQEVDPQVAELRQRSASSASSWWWN